MYSLDQYIIVFHITIPYKLFCGGCFKVESHNVEFPAYFQPSVDLKEEIVLFQTSMRHQMKEENQFLSD
jgi:hypothetical protein